jgi:uncharacterized membrane protein
MSIRDQEMNQHPLPDDRSVDDSKSWLGTYLVTLTVALVWLLLICLPPWLMVGGQVDLALVGYRLFSIICHQIPDRSWQIAGLPIAVCSRCTAIYVGGLVGLFLYPCILQVRSRAGWMAGQGRPLLALALLPMLADVALDLLGVRQNTFLTRAITGGLAGIALALYLTPTLLSAGADWRRGSLLNQTGDNRHE